MVLYVRLTLQARFCQ